jgi:pilus assembly protein Flp/PilA
MLYAPKEKGQGLVEYALILVFVAIVVIVVLALLGPAIGAVFSNVIELI